MNFPLPASKETILGVLDDIRAGVESGDTLEGFIQFSVAPDGPEPFEMLTRYRVDNLYGQGSLRTFGAMENPHGV